MNPKVMSGRARLEGNNCNTKHENRQTQLGVKCILEEGKRDLGLIQEDSATLRNCFPI